MTFGEKLKQIRIGSRLTQEQMADIVGVERKTIARYETGDTIPRLNKVYEKLSEYFGSTTDFWKNDSPEDFQQTAAIAYGADGKIQAQKLIEDAAGLFAGGALSDEDKEAVFNALQKVYWEIKVEKAKNETK
ncbi:MAG: helix-turn-helix transcriptional regulator [Ruminococcus sp.]|nr:helix-turn-helix transcriptional regulator [Ruminococcus sp.]